MLFEFGDFVLDLQRHELRRAGVTCPLEPKAFRVLSYLLPTAIARSLKKNF